MARTTLRFNRALQVFLLGLLILSIMSASALAQTPTYPVPNGPNIAPSSVERPASVLGNKITQESAEVLPLTGGDAVGLAILAGMLIALGTAMNLRRKPKSTNS